MVLDVALMHGRRVEGALKNNFGLLEPRVHIAPAQLVALGNVRRLGGGGLDALGEDGLMQDGRTGLHGLDHADDVRQHLVLDLDELERLARDRRLGRRNRGHRMAVIEHLFTRHDVARHVAVVDHQLARWHGFRRHVLEIIPGHHGLDARQRFGLRGVDGFEARVRVRAAQHPADQHARQEQVGAKPRPSRYLINAIGPHRPRAHPLQFAVLRLLRVRHVSSPSFPRPRRARPV